MELRRDLEAGVPRSLFRFDAAIGGGVDPALHSMFDSGASAAVSSRCVILATLRILVRFKRHVRISQGV
jgi:hypothetical protein